MKKVFNPLNMSKEEEELYPWFIGWKYNHTVVIPKTLAKGTYYDGENFDLVGTMLKSMGIPVEDLPIGHTADVEFLYVTYDAKPGGKNNYMASVLLWNEFLIDHDVLHDMVFVSDHRSYTNEEMIQEFCNILTENHIPYKFYYEVDICYENIKKHQEIVQTG